MGTGLCALGPQVTVEYEEKCCHCAFFFLLLFFAFRLSSLGFPLLLGSLVTVLNIRLPLPAWHWRIHDFFVALL